MRVSASFALLASPCAAGAAIAWCAVVCASSCTLDPPIAGARCASDDDCNHGNGFYCQLETAPTNVCIPGGLGVPPPPGHAPVLGQAVVVVDDASGAAHGVFSAYDIDDPSGAHLAFTPSSLTLDLGTLVVDAHGTYYFTAAAGAVAETSARYPLAVTGARGVTAQGEALVLIAGTGAFVHVWNGATDDMSDGASWTPAGTPSASTSVIVGAAPNGAHARGVVDVNGWLSDGAADVSVDGSLNVHGNRWFAGAPINGDGSVALAPAQLGAATIVRVAGELPETALGANASIEAATHVAGSLVTSSDAAVVVDVHGRSLVVDGALAGGGAAPSLRAAGGAVMVGGALTLVDDKAGTSLVNATVVVGGDVTLGKKASGANVTLVLNGAAPQNVDAGDPSLMRFLDIHVQPGAQALFTSDAAVGGALVVAGAVGVAADHVVNVDTLILRPSFSSIEPAHGGAIRAHQCLVALGVRAPAFIQCTVEVPPPPEPADGGVSADAGPAIGDPSRCSLSPGYTNDLVRHGLVVAIARAGAVVSDRFESDGDSFVPGRISVRGGDLDLRADGTYTFTSNGIPGEESADVEVEIASPPDAPPIGAVAGCIDLRLVDEGAVNELQSASWDDSASWSQGRLPDENDVVIVPPLLIDGQSASHVAGSSGPPLTAKQLFVVSGATLDASERTLRVTQGAFVGGTYIAGVGGAIDAADGAFVGGRVDRLSCAGAVHFASATVMRELRADSLSTTCALKLDGQRVHVTGDLAPGAPLDVYMDAQTSALIVSGAMNVPDLGGALNAGEIDVDGDASIGDWSRVVGTIDHHFFLRSPAALALRNVRYPGFLTVLASSQTPAPLTITLDVDGEVGGLVALRQVDVNGPQHSFLVDNLMVTSTFETQTPDAYNVLSCAGPSTSQSATVCP